MTHTKILFYPTKSTSDNRYLNNLYNTIKNSFNVTGFDEIKKTDYFKYDIYHFNWIESTIGSTTRLILTKFFIYTLKLLNKKIIWTIHNTIPHETNNKKDVINFMKFMARKSDRIHILCTETLNNNLLTPYKNKTVLIPHGDYIGNYPKGDTNIYDKYNIPKYKKIILFIGKIRKYKNIELLIRAFIESGLEKNDFVLLICGKCNNQDYKKELKTIQNGSIFFDFNFIKDFEMECYLTQSEIIVAPYNKNSSLNSGVLWMAMSYKKTMMLPLIGCVKDIKDYDKILYIYNYKNGEHYEKLLECMKKLKSEFVKNRNELEIRGENAYNYIINNQSRKFQEKNRINLYKF